MIHPYLKPLIAQFEASRDPVRAGQMKKYLKGQFEFYGIGTPARRALMKAHFMEYGLPDWSHARDISLQLWEFKERECQHTLVDLLNRMKKNLAPEDLPLIETLITTKSWWDTVDGVAGWLAGDLFRRHREMIHVTTRRWMDSGNLWLQRSCLLFQLKYRKETDTGLLFGFIDELTAHKSFWIRKAIGWSLREYSKSDPQAVRKYVETHPGLSGLSRREALKVIIR
jgi:3-methyladenine DNA glycosylase AlkD